MSALLWWFLGVSVVTFFVFGYDKQAAIQQNWRIPEKTLLTLGVIGGAAGGLVGMYAFHHKTRKTLFRVVFPLAALAQLGLLLILNR